MDYFYKNLKSADDFSLVQDVCHFILNQKVEDKPINNEWGAIFVEGRNRQVTDFESFCAIKSFKLFSKYNAPVYLFLNNRKNLIFEEYDLMEKWNIKIIDIPELNSLEKYSNFCINELYFLLPLELKYVITLQQDAMLLRNGFEDWIQNNNFDLIGSAWQHYTSLRHFDDKENTYWSFKEFSPVSGCNLGFSYRNVEKMIEISKKFSKFNLRQIGDINCPEDSFYSYFGYGSKICNLPTREEMNKWSKDPLTRNDWNNKNYGYGYHYIRSVSEFINE